MKEKESEERILYPPKKHHVSIINLSSSSESWAPSLGFIAAAMTMSRRLSAGRLVCLVITASFLSRIIGRCFKSCPFREFRCMELNTCLQGLSRVPTQSNAGCDSGGGIRQTRLPNAEVTCPVSLLGRKRGRWPHKT